MKKTQSSLSKQFMVVWFGQWISTMGSGISAFALGVYVFKLTHSASYYAWVLLAAFMPSLLLKPVGGMLADFFDRRIMMMIGDMGCAVSLIFMIVMLSVYPHSLWPIYFGTLLSALAMAIQNPAYKASLTDLLDESAYSKGSGLVQLAESSKYVISPMIAGLLMSIFSIVSVLVIDCVSFLIAVVTVFFIRQSIVTHQKIKDAMRENFIGEFFRGFSYLFKQKPLLLLLIIISMIAFFVGILQALWGPMILSFSNPKALGLSQSVATLGMLVSSLWIGALSGAHHKIRWLSVSLVLGGLFFAAMGLKQNVWSITIAGLLFFLALPFANTSLDVLVRRNIDNAMQGRVWAAVSLISQLGMGIAFGVAGFLSSHLSYPLLLRSEWLMRYLGSTPGSGIGLTLMVSGLCISCVGIFIASYKKLKSLDA